MDYRRLGNSGLKVSEIGLGCNNFGMRIDQAATDAVVAAALDAGVNFFDTADIYGGLKSEVMLGQALGARRAEVIVATKFANPTGARPDQRGGSRGYVVKAVEASLKRLGTDYIDLYQMHLPDADTPIEETLRALDDAVRMGKILYVGLSNFTGWQVQKTMDVAAASHLSRPVTLQPQYNLLVREIEWEIVPACQAEGLGLLPWSPLGGGWLTGKYHRDQRPSGATRLGENPERGVEAYGRRSAQQRTWDVLSALRTVAGARGCSMAQVALAWVRDRPAVSSVILGCRTVEQLDDNLGAADLDLSEEEVEALDQASDPGAADYPYGQPGADQRSRKIGGGR
jgi:aryl-alcohol dehydrogenase-like predicted oxidoreductase